jgi:hypothetical protein
VLRVPTPPLNHDPAARRNLAVSAVVAALAFACYHATLLPGLDFGDTAAYQSVVGEWRVSPRQAYPLYFLIANAAYALVGGEPARVLNLLSAVAGALACGATVWLGASLTRSLLADWCRDSSSSARTRSGRRP